MKVENKETCAYSVSKVCKKRSIYVVQEKHDYFIRISFHKTLLDTNTLPKRCGWTVHLLRFADIRDLEYKLRCFCNKTHHKEENSQGREH